MSEQAQPNALRRTAAFSIGILCVLDPCAGFSALPLRELLVLGFAVATALPSRRRDLSAALSGTGWVAVVAVALVLLSGIRSHSALRAVAEPLQLGVYIIVLPVLLGGRRALRQPLAWGLCAGMAGAAAAALLLGIRRLDLSAGALLDNRFLYGVALAAMVPVARGLVTDRQLPQGWQTVSAALAGCVALTLTSVVPALLCLVAVLYSARRWQDQPSRDTRPRLIVAAWIAGMLIGLCVVNGRLAAQSVAVRGGSGVTRRWVQEAVAGMRAVAAAPFLGHGSGRYQETVSSGMFRRDLPRPAESTVEPGMQSGVLVRAVEHGLPAALAILVVIGAAAAAATAAGDDDEAWSAGVSPGLCILGLGMFVTPATTRAGGLFVGAMLALARRGRAPRLGAARSAVQLGTVAAAATIMLLARCRPKPAPAAGRVPPTPRFAVVIEAETAAGITSPAVVADKHLSAAGKALHLPDGALDAKPPDTLASWSFNIAAPARITTWFRVRWQDGCGNSFAIGIDGTRPVLVGNDGTYQAWHWVKGPTADVDAGTHRLALQPREDGIWLDQILVTSHMQARPMGILTPDGSPAPPVDDVPPPAPAARDVPVPLPPQTDGGLVRREHPFRAGFGGCYRGGFEAALLELGLPWDKVHDSDLIRPERLAAFSVICLSEMKDLDGRRMFRALEQYIRSGGVLVYENHTGPIPSEYRSSRRLIPTRVGWRLEHGYGAALKTDASPIFGDIPPGTTLKLARDVPFLALRGSTGSEWKGYGSIVRYRRRYGAAVWERALGKGRVYYCRVPMSFHTMWRSPVLMPPLRNLLTELTRHNATPIAPVPDPTPPEAPEDSFSDDFMRAGGPAGPGWIASGRVRCTGERGPQRHTEFCLELRGAADARADTAGTGPHAVSAAVLPSHGDGGVWIETDTGSGSLVCMGGTSVVLGRSSGGESRTAAQVELPPGGGWHRLSLVPGDDAWEGYVDGVCVARMPPPPGEYTDARTVIRSDKGSLFVDDVDIRPCTSLIPGTDRCLGDEGSSQSWAGLEQGGIETRTVYSLQWHARPSADFSNAVVLSLPNYTAGALLDDGAPAADVDPDPDGAVIALAEPQRPRRHIGFRCPGWRDFVFRERQTEWFCTGADWTPLARWSCDPRWTWLGAETRRRTALWYRHELRPPYAISAVVSLGARHRFGEEYNRGRDMNFALGATDPDPMSGLAVRAMNAERTGIQVWRDGTLIARAASVGLPSGHSLHHNWFELTAIVEEKRLRVRFEGREVLDVALAEPVQPGKAAVWTENNSIRVARLTLSLSP